MAYEAKMVKGVTYNLQGIDFKLGQQKPIPDRLKDYVDNHANFELVKVEKEPTDDINEMDVEELKAYAAAHNVDIGNATSENGIRQKIKDAQKEDNE